MGERKGIERKKRGNRMQLKKVYELRLLAGQTAKAPKARAGRADFLKNAGDATQRSQRSRKVCENATTTILFLTDILLLETRSRFSSRISIYTYRV